MFDRSQLEDHVQPRNTNARQAAEALFAPKRAPPDQSVRETSVSNGQQARKPRVLAISRPVPSSSQVGLEGPISPTQQVTQKIPRSQFARIRAWRRYGMTAQQVAEVYGVGVEEIERIRL
jgi:hypothetical protein